MAKQKAPELEIEWVNPADLKPYDHNAKLHPPGQIEQLKDQIKQFGFDVPIVALPDKTIIKGHGRTMAALALGLKKVPVLYKKLTKEQAIASRIADNKVAESGWDYDKLKLDFSFLKDMNFDFNYTGFSPDEIKVIQSEWETDLNKVQNEQEHLDGIKSVIKIRCNNEHREAIKDFIITKILEHGFKEVEVE